MSDEARTEDLNKPGPYEGARGVYGDIGRSGKAAYERLAEEARINNVLLALETKRTDEAAVISRKAGQRTITQRSENNLRNNLGKIQRQYENYKGNVEHALGSLSIKEAADEASFAARKAADDKAKELSQHRFDADYELQKQQLDLYRTDSDFNKAYQLYLKRLIKKDKFKDITGIAVKSLPVRRKPKPLIIQLKQTDTATESSDPNYTLVSSVNLDSSITKYLVSNKLIEDAGKVGVEVIDKSGRLRDESVLRRDIYGEGVKPAIVPEGAAESGIIGKDPDYVKLAFSDSYGRATSCYMKKDVYDFANGKGVDLDVNGIPKSDTQLMRDLYGIGEDGTVDYALLAKNLEDGGDKIIDMFGLENYRIMAQYTDYMKAAAPSLGVQPLKEAVETLESMVMHPDMYKGENSRDYFDTLNEQFGAVGNELSIVETDWQTIGSSGNMYSYSAMLRSFVEGALSTLPEEEASALPDTETLCKSVAAAIAGGTPDAKAQMILDKLPETIIGLLKYKNGLDEDTLRRDNDLMPAGLYEKLENADMPVWYKMPEEWTAEAFTDAINIYMQHAYWQDKLGENYDEEWTAGMPTMESFIEQGRRAAKEKGLGISDDYAACYGILTNSVELMENNEDARKQAEGVARNIFGTEEPLAVENDKVLYMLDPVTGFISDLKIKNGITESANDVTKAVNDTVGYMLWKKSSGEELSEPERAFFEKYGMDKIASLIDSRGKGDYYKLTDSSKDAMKSDMLKEANYALYDFSPEELDFLKTSSVQTLNEKIQGEELSGETDKQWLSALKLYRYYKNDLGLEVTGDYEADRTAAKDIVSKQLEDLGYESFHDAVTKIGESNSQDIRAEMDGMESTDTPEMQKANEILQNAPPELFMNTADETEEVYKTGAFVAGVRNAFTLGLAGLFPENVADPEEVKRFALLGNPVNGTEFYKCGRFYTTAIAQEDARMAKENPWAYWIGNIVGGLPYGFATGALTKAASLPVSLAINAIPSAIQGGAEAAAQGGDALDIIKGVLVEGTKGAISGKLSDIAEEGLTGLLSKAPGFFKKAVPAVAGSGVEALSNAAFGLGEDLISGKEIDWEQVLSNLSSDFISSLISKSWHADDDTDTVSKRSKGDTPAGQGGLPDVSKPIDTDTKVTDPVSGADVTIPKGMSLADINPEAAKFYDAAVKTIGVRAVNLDIPVSKSGSSTKSDDDLFLDYANSVGTDDMPSLGDFAKLRSEGGAAWDELTLKKNYKEALKRGDIHPFARFEDYKKAADYIRSNSPETAADPGNFDAAVKNIVNEAYETGRPLEDIVETVKAKTEGDIDGGTEKADNANNKEKIFKQSNIDKSIVNRILSTPKSKRPKPETYLNKGYIDGHLANFKDGVTKIMPYPSYGTIGGKGGTFVLSKVQADELIKSANGDIYKLEDLLGFDRGYLGTNPVRADIISPKGLRMPSGRELGANDYWLPGGYTSGGIMEAVIDPAQYGTYTISYIK